ISILLEEYRSRRLDNLLNKKTKGKRSEIHSLIDAEDKFKDVNTTNLERQLLLKKDYMYSDELAAIALETPALKLTTDNFGIYSKSDKWNTDEDLYSKIATGERDYSFVFALGTDDDGLDGKRYVSGRFFRDKKTGAVLVLYSDPIGRKNIDNEFKNFVRKFLGDGAKIINTNGRRKAIDLSTEANPKELANGLYALDAVASGGLFDRVQNELEQLSSGKSQLPKGLEMSEITPMTRTEKEKERRVKNKKAVHTPKVMEFS
ncbi:MAG: hypothetical protein LBP39_01165, partial [Rickettsiales bacterium]|nr:hypothetical protein [Rickettsiales bacterium]